MRLGHFGFIGPLGALLTVLFLSIPTSAHANLSPLTFRYEHHLFSIDPDRYPWSRTRDVWMYQGQEISLPETFRVDGDILPPLPAGVTIENRVEWDAAEISETLDNVIGKALHRDAGSVTITRGTGGTIVFDGVGLTGRKLQTDAAAALTIEALHQDITDIFLPVTETQPKIIVADPSLASQGIQEVVTIGESNYSGSPINRQHNIRVGLSKFNGHLIPKGDTFSFNKILGLVDGSTGYRRELVIKGDRTEPEYGGGLCQVSTTAYRGVWEYGFPIAARINHSYAVSYYFPQGTDATVYPPFPDMRFTNNSPGALLMQTHTENNHAYFIYYGTRDTRTAEVLGPFTWGSSAPPPDRTIYTTELPVGTKQKLGERHSGISVAWYRFTTTATGAKLMEPVYSIYEARPLFYEVGVETLPEDGINEDGPVITPDELNTPEPAKIF